MAHLATIVTSNIIDSALAWMSVPTLRTLRDVLIVRPGALVVDILATFLEALTFSVRVSASRLIPLLRLIPIVCRITVSRLLLEAILSKLIPCVWTSLWWWHYNQRGWSRNCQVSTLSIDPQRPLNYTGVGSGPGVSTLHQFHDVNVQTVHKLCLSCLIGRNHGRRKLCQLVKLRNVFRYWHVSLTQIHELSNLARCACLAQVFLKKEVDEVYPCHSRYIL